MIQLRKLTMQKVNLVSTLRATLSCASLLTLVIACGKTESNQQPEAAEAQPVAVVEEAPKESLNDMMKRLGIDKRVRVEDGDKAPSNPIQAEVIVVFFDAMVHGNAAKLKPLLSPQDQAVLADMQASGQWKSATENINRVNVGWITGTEPDTLSVLGFFSTGDTFAAQLWSLSSGANDQPLVMTALASPQKIEEKLQGSKTADRIKQWLTLNKLELSEAKKPDETIEVPQQDRSIKGDAPGRSGSDDDPPRPSSRPGKRAPSDPVEKP